MVLVDGRRLLCASRKFCAHNAVADGCRIALYQRLWTSRHSSFANWVSRRWPCIGMRLLTSPSRPPPRNLSLLTNLKELILSNNNLEGTLPRQMQHLTNLVEFSATGNNFHGQVFLPASLRKLYLKMSFSSLMPLYGDFRSLQNVRDCAFGNSDVADNHTCFKNCPFSIAGTCFNNYRKACSSDDCVHFSNFFNVQFEDNDNVNDNGETSSTRAGVTLVNATRMSSQQMGSTGNLQTTAVTSTSLTGSVEGTRFRTIGGEPTSVTTAEFSDETGRTTTLLTQSSMPSERASATTKGPGTGTEQNEREPHTQAADLLWLYILIPLVLLLVGVGAILFCVLRRRSSGENDDNGTAQSSAPNAQTTEMDPIYGSSSFSALN